MSVSLATSSIPRNGDPPRGANVPWRLVEEIIALSVSDNWDEAKREWQLDHIYRAGVPGVCLCGKTPIIEHCEIFNRANGNTVTVGNHCVEQFLNLPSDKLFAALRRVGADPSASLNAEMVEHAYEHGWINQWQAQFYLNTLRKRKLSPRQRAKRVEINERVLTLVGEGAASAH